MDNRRRRRHHHVLLLLLLLCRCRFCSAEFDPTDNYCLNCGSTVRASFSDGSDTRSFRPDSTNVDGVTFSFDGSSTLTNPNSSASTPELYRTARFFRNNSSYTFSIRKQGTHVVRLHFYPFSTNTQDLSSSVEFNVSVSGTPLLTAFSPQSSSGDTSDPLVLKEFYLHINVSSFFISFSANGFVSAIEVVSVPDELLNNTPQRIVPGRGTEDYIGLSTQMLEKVYRINVGGAKVLPVNDPLWRTWVTDDDFLRTKSLALKKTGNPKYLSDVGGSELIAPASIYGTARELNGSAVSDSGGQLNLTWALKVSSRRQRYLVRMHFCDIVSAVVGDLVFNSYINGFSAYKDIDIAKLVKEELRVPHYDDTVVDAGDAAELVVSVGPSSTVSGSKRNAILNGLEVMKMNGELVLTENAGKGRNLWEVVGAVLGSLVFVGVAIVLGLIVVRRRKRRRRKTPTTATSGGSEWVFLHPSRYSQTTAGSTGSPFPNLNLELKLPFASILLATKNFDGNHQIGQGGFGKVYKGVLQDGRTIAVKRGSRGSGQGLPEFYTEITMLSKIRHRHLVSLIGYCEEQSEMILVYEFMEKGTLRDHLYGPNRAARPPLSWIQRLEICIGSARGLHYLHSGSDAQGIIHRDVKSANILLDGNYVAKVADFGLSKLGPLLDETHVSTNVKGSFGYFDPEYFKTRQLTDKSDVYSFGVVLLEVLCARPAIDSSLPWDQQNLADWGLKCIKRGKLDQIVDASISETINTNSLRKYGETTEKCLSKYGVDRPSMADVMWNLDYALKLQQTARAHQPFDDSVTIVSTAVPTNSSSTDGSGDTTATNLALQVPMPDASDDSQLSSAPVFSQLVTTQGR